MRVFVVFVCMISCVIGVAQNDNVKVSSEGYEGVVFDESYRCSFYKKATQTFTPTQEEIKLVEASIVTDFEMLCGEMRHRNCPETKKLSKYKRQYFGYYDEDGNRIIYVNCFYSPSDEKALYFSDWETREIVVFDGGNNYWQISFNLHTGKLFGLSINGEA